MPRSLDEGTIKAALERKTASYTPAQRIKYINSVVSRIDKMRRPGQVFSLMRRVFREQQIDDTYLAFNEPGLGFDSWRPLTFAERKVNFRNIRDRLNELEDGFIGTAKEEMVKEKERYMKALERAVEAQDAQAIKDLNFRLKTSYKSILKEHYKESFQLGKVAAANEMKVEVPPNPMKQLRQIEILSETTAEDHIQQLRTESKRTLSQSLAQGATAKQAIDSVEKELNKKIRSLTRNTGKIAMASAMNNGRRTVFETYPERIYALQRSEVLDSVTCNYCLSVDGRIVRKNDSFARTNIYHSNCRGIWVEILVDEEEKPPIEGVPKTLRSRFGDNANDLIQPKNPITKKDSLARKEVLRRIEREKKDE